MPVDGFRLFNFFQGSEAALSAARLRLRLNPNLRLRLRLRLLKVMEVAEAESG